MALSLHNITFDCSDVSTVSAFWSAALDVPIDEGANDFFASLNGGHANGPAWLFLAVPEAKTAKNRNHLDLSATDRETEVARLVGLGASRVANKDEWGMRWTVLGDPEGNEFCVS